MHIYVPEHVHKSVHVCTYTITYDICCADRRLCTSGTGKKAFLNTIHIFLY